MFNAHGTRRTQSSRKAQMEVVRVVETWAPSITGTTLCLYTTTNATRPTTDIGLSYRLRPTEDLE